LVGLKTVIEYAPGFAIVAAGIEAVSCVVDLKVVVMAPLVLSNRTIEFAVDPPPIVSKFVPLIVMVTALFAVTKAGLMLLMVGVAAFTAPAPNARIATLNKKINLAKCLGIDKKK